MPLPTEFNTVTVHGKWVRLDGTPERGSVRFTPSIPRLVHDPTGTVIMRAQQTVVLDANGEITTSLPATDDPDIQGPFHYIVEMRLTGAGDTSPTYSFPLQVPVAGGTVELADSSVAQSIPLPQVPPKPVTGSRGGNVALANLLTALHSLGLIVDQTTG